MLLLTEPQLCFSCNKDPIRPLGLSTRGTLVEKGYHQKNPAETLRKPAKCSRCQKISEYCRELQKGTCTSKEPFKVRDNLGL